MGRVGPARAERALDQVPARRLAGPRLRQTVQQRELRRPREPHDPLSPARRPPAAVDDQVRRREHRLYLGQGQGPRLARGDETRRRQDEGSSRLLDLRAERPDARPRRCLPRAGEGLARLIGSPAAERDLEGDQGGDG